MAKLYQKQNIGLSRGSILQPLQPTSYGSVVRGATKIATTALDKVVVENWTLGHANLVNDILTQAYEQNPNNLARFNEMVESGVLKATEKLPESLARKLRAGAESKASAFQTKIKNNQMDAFDAEQKQKIGIMQETLTGDTPLGVAGLQKMIYDGLINKDENQVIQAKKNLDAARKQLSNLAEVKNSRGNYVIGTPTERNALKQGEFGMMDAFRTNIESLPKDGLVDFYNNVFQDKKKYMENTGVSFESYDKQDKIITDRIKAFDMKDKIEMRDQDFFEASRISKVDPAVWEDIKSHGTLKQETIDTIDKAIKEAGKKGDPDKVFFTDQNQGFLAGLAELQNAISTDTGAPDYNDKLLQAAAKVDMNIAQMHRNGLGDEQTEILRRALSGVVSDQNFADALNMNDDSFFSEIVRGANNDYRKSVESAAESIRAKYANNPNPMAQRQMEQELKDLELNKWANPYLRNRRTEFTGQTKTALNELAGRYSAQIVALEQAGQHEQAMQLKHDANKELIFLKYSDWIPRQEFARLENALANGKKAYTQIGGSMFEYKGLTQNGIAVEGVF